MLNLLFVWLAVGIALALLIRKSSAGLLLAYFVGLSMIHVPGAMMFLEAGEWNRTRLGFEQTVIGLVAFLIGAVITRMTAFPRRLGVDRPNSLSPKSATELNQLAFKYVLLGGVIYFFLMSYASAIPSATAIMSPLGSLIIVGACLRLWVARNSGNRFNYWSTIGILPLLPLSTLVQSGFLGFGVVWAIAIASFLFAQSNRRWVFFCLAPVVLFAGLSLFVNYMGARDKIRQSVWYDQSDLSTRLDKVGVIFRNFEWLDLSDPKQRQEINLRLNQNGLVGAAVARLDSGLQPYASGATLFDAFLSLIPRAIWPDKPSFGGGGGIVSKYTGIRFAKNTSVGVGQVLEFYLNFGTLGVIGGFFIFGWVLGYVDLKIIESLGMGDRRNFLLWFLIGASMLQPGGSVVEIVVAVAGSVVGSHGLNYFLNPRKSAADLPIMPRKMTA